MRKGVNSISRERRQERDRAGPGGGSMEVTKRSQGMGTLTEVGLRALGTTILEREKLGRVSKTGEKGRRDRKREGKRQDWGSEVPKRRGR